MQASRSAVVRRLRAAVSSALDASAAGFAALAERDAADFLAAGDFLIVKVLRSGEH